METKHDIVVNNKRGIQFKFAINRKFTVIRGDSATGKTTLWQMVADANSSTMSGITISCDVPLKVLGVDSYQRNLKENKGIIYIIDEDFPTLLTKEFAKAVLDSDNCFIVITREPLVTIPYSYKEIYEIKTSGKFHSLQRIYPDYESFYRKNRIVTEDEDAGLEYYQKVIDGQVESSKGNSNLSKYGTEETLLIGDGSAIGPYIMDLCLTNAKIFLPESFEYLLLQSPIFETNAEVKRLVNDPASMITTEYVSWERYFTDFLIRITNNTSARYSKSHLNECYYKECCCKGSHCDFFITKKKVIKLDS